MKKQRLALFISSFLLIALVNWLGHWAIVQAQTPPSTPTPIPIALTSGASSPTYRPADLLQSDNPTTRSLVGEDNRIPVVSQKFPWAAIGRIYWVKADGQRLVGVGYCTGTLISQDLVLTNSHCLEHPDTEQLIDPATYQTIPDKLAFLPNMIGGGFVEQDLAIVSPDYIYGWQSNQSPAEDWALLKINKPLGEKYGYLGWRVLDFANPNILNALRGQIRVAGYSGDYPNEQQKQDWGLEGGKGETASVQIGCSIDGLSENLPYRSNGGENLPNGWLLHDCDTMGGSSGSAILAKFDDGNYSVIGLHRGSVNLDPASLPPNLREPCTTKNGIASACRNIGVQVSRWATQAMAMR